MELEIWKDIVGYEGYYQVSNIGRVRSVERFISYCKINRTQKYPSLILKQCLNTVGYFQVSLSINQQRKRRVVHRLVAEAFCCNINNKPVVNHIDGDYLNNNAYNLEWCTHIENVHHAISTGLYDNYGEKSPNSKFTNKQADIIRKIKNSGISIKDISILLSVNKSSIQRILNMKTYNINNKIKSYK